MTVRPVWPNDRVNAWELATIWDSSLNRQVIATGGRSRRRRRFSIIGGCILIVLFLGYLLVRLAIPGLVSVVLKRNLKVPVHIGHMEISPFADTIRLTEFRLGQPEGYDHEPMLSAKKVEIAGWRGFFSANRHLGEIRITELHLDITTNRNNQTNLIDWIRSIEGDPEEGSQPAKTDNWFFMMIDRVSVETIHIARHDYSVSAGSHELTIEKGKLDILNLVIGPYPEAPAGLARFHGELVQPETENAGIMVGSQFGPITADDPVLRSSVRLTGCLYQTFVPVIPSNTDRILGGKGFDFDLDLAVSEGYIQAKGTARTSNGSFYSFRVLGPIEEPDFQLPQALVSVTTRMGGGIGRLMNSTLHSGKEILVGAVDTAASFGKGALHATGSFLKGTGRMVGGAVTGSEDARNTGLQEMTSESGDHLAGAFSGSADAVSKAGSRTTEALSNDPSLQAWISQIPARHEERAKAAQEDLFQAAFPPAIPNTPQGAGK